MATERRTAEEQITTTAGGEHASLRIPSWVRCLGGAVWISSPDRTICFVNRKAERVLKIPADEIVGQPCFRVIAARCSAGDPFCAPRCPFLRLAEEQRSMEPVSLQVGGQKSGIRWIQILVIPIWAAEHAGPYLVHCAWSADRAHQAEQYLMRIASRSAYALDGPGKRERLSRREKEILAHLSLDEDLPTIAATLHISHATVRNHVQHILAKLQAHSVQEAIALHLLGNDE